jgi:RimJ/RimL family protein N-acetyltransferase
MAIIRTARLTMTPFVEADVADLFAVRGDQEAMTHWDWPADRTINETRIVAQTILEEMSGGNAFYWTARNERNAFTGLFDLSELSACVADIGFMVARRFWRRGYGQEGAWAVVNEAWRRNLTGLKARVHASNQGSAALLERLGFREGRPAEDVEVRPGVFIRCRFFELPSPAR